MRVKTNNCPFCGAPLLLESIPSRYGCGTLVGRPYYCQRIKQVAECMDIKKIRAENALLRAENAKLREFIDRAENLLERLSTEF